MVLPQVKVEDALQIETNAKPPGITVHRDDHHHFQIAILATEITSSSSSCHFRIKM